MSARTLLIVSYHFAPSPLVGAKRFSFLARVRTCAGQQERRRREPGEHEPERRRSDVLAFRVDRGQDRLRHAVSIRRCPRRHHGVETADSAKQDGSSGVSIGLERSLSLL